MNSKVTVLLATVATVLAFQISCSQAPPAVPDTARRGRAGNPQQRGRLDERI